MPKTLYIGDDITTAETKVLFAQQDFIDLVERHMGCDARSYLEHLICADEQMLKEVYDNGYEDGRRDAYEAMDDDAW